MEKEDIQNVLGFYSRNTQKWSHCIQETLKINSLNCSSHKPLINVPLAVSIFEYTSKTIHTDKSIRYIGKDLNSEFAKERFIKE